MKKLSTIAQDMVNLTTDEASQLLEILATDHNVKLNEPEVQEVVVEAVVAEVQTHFSVTLEDAGATKRIRVVKLIKDYTALGLKESKALVDDAPCTVLEGVSREEADEFISKLNELDGKGSIK